MKKLILIILLAASILSLTACRRTGSFSGEAVARSNTERRHQTLDDILANPDARSLSTFNNVRTAGTGFMHNRTGPDYAIFKEEYEYVPVEMFLLYDNYDGFDEFVNNSYYSYAISPLWPESIGVHEYLNMFLITDEVDGNEYLNVAIIGTDEQEGWSELKEEENVEVFVYFRLIGYSYELRMPVGILEFFEYLVRDW